MSTFWNVAVSAPLPRALTYSSDSLNLVRGQLVEVPLGKGERKSLGVVLGPGQPSEEFAVKSIFSLQEEYSPLPENYLKWIEWMAKYYVHPPGLVASLAFPPLAKQTKVRKSKKAPVVKPLEFSPPPTLTDEQAQVVSSILSQQGFSAHLVFGVTGSGKTEIYLRLLEETLKVGQTGIVLVPEISLTPQLVQRFASRFGDQVAVLHSQLTDRERTQQWWNIIDKQKRILIGARSALFCPIEDLGIIIVDEEHEPSFKQDEKLKYHGRDSAVALARFQNCPVVLGSATPSLESWKNALDKKYQLHELKQRVAARAMPEFQVIDMRVEKEKPEKNPDLPSWLSEPLYEALANTLERGDQAALFLNRRGMASMVLCGDCGHVIECPNCDISLTLHGRHHLVCHYCDYHESMKEKCPDCHEGELTTFGLGTETLEEDMRRLFPQARIARADRDEVNSREDLENLITDMESGEIDILVGTQMIAKGLDFPSLNLVGLVLADVGFNLPDFRATERSFQLITQVAGRAGRHVKPGQAPGQVIIQTYNTQHPALQYAIKNDFVGFAQEELAIRQDLNYPPHGRLVAFRIQGTQLGKVEQGCKILAQRCKQLRQSLGVYEKIEVLGPAEAPLSKLRGQFRFHLLLKGPDAPSLNGFVRQVLGDESWLPPSVRVSADVDPLHLL